MDYLDPIKQARQRWLLRIGYILISIGIVFAALVLLDQAYGYGINDKGQVIQNGLVFFSSQPVNANIYVDNKLKANTNTKVYLQEGIYKVSLTRQGYLPWQRTIEVDGGSVNHYDYPFLIPQTLSTNKLAAYAAAPELVSQSPDGRWLLVGRPGDINNFDLYDLRNSNPATAVTTISLPSGLLSKASSPGETWQLDEWADDNQHILLQHNYDGKTEFILVDRANPGQSINLNTSLAMSPANLALKNKKYDQYYIYDSNSQTLQSAALQSTDKTTVLDHVQAYQSYGNSTILYVTSSGAPAGKVWLKMLSGGQTYNLHELPASPAYVLNLTEYNGVMYVAAGASSGSKVYIYKDPLGQLASQPSSAVTPIQVLNVNQPNYLSFSNNAQFIVAENGSQFGVYDIQNKKGYNYTAALPDVPQTHASWMDGDRLDYVSGGKLLIFDYDHTNQHALEAASSQYQVAFAPNYKYVYSLGQNPTTNQYDLDQTWLLAPADR